MTNIHFLSRTPLSIFKEITFTPKKDRLTQRTCQCLLSFDIVKLGAFSNRYLYIFFLEKKRFCFILKFIILDKKL